MATPYLQIRVDEVPSTQDFAKSRLEELPLLVVAQRQTAGRGRSGAEWTTAPRALATSIAFRVDPDESRPLSLVAGVAAARTKSAFGLKWPNDLMIDDSKVGGILVERADAVVVIGMGLNLWWPDAPDGYGALSSDDPGAKVHAEIAGLWAAELMLLVEGEGWPVDEYRDRCVTIGRSISWEPDGSGLAVDVNVAGELLVEADGDIRAIRSGAVSHIRG
ncbi:MAG: biotin--[acetyl-CoA-carboxylase] ligase [Actinobacteria bacterium]|nr:biotin--[acetyl-CoA-carboxylase] ligase [Actinomycetota bacterium]